MSACKYCHKVILWVQFPTGWRPLEEDGSQHKCSQRRMTQRSKARGGPLVVRGARIVGEKYTPSCGDCSTPPWESCACSGIGK